MQLTSHEVVVFPSVWCPFLSWHWLGAPTGRCCFLCIRYERERVDLPNKKTRGLVVVRAVDVATISTVDALFVMLVHHVICRVRVSTLGGKAEAVHLFIPCSSDKKQGGIILHEIVFHIISYRLCYYQRSLRHKFNFQRWAGELQVSTSFINAARNFLLVCTVFCRTVQSLTTPSWATRRQSVYSGLQPQRRAQFYSLSVLLTRADPSQNIDIFSPL